MCQITWQKPITDTITIKHYCGSLHTNTRHHPTLKEICTSLSIKHNAGFAIHSDSLSTLAQYKQGGHFPVCIEFPDFSSHFQLYLRSCTDCRQHYRYMWKHKSSINLTMLVIILERTTHNVALVIFWISANVKQTVQTSTCGHSGLVYRHQQTVAWHCQPQTQWFCNYTARLLAAQCIVISPVCLSVFAMGGQAGGVRTLLQPARSVCISLSAFSLFMFILHLSHYSQ